MYNSYAVVAVFIVIMILLQAKFKRICKSDHLVGWLFGWCNKVMDCSWIYEQVWIWVTYFVASVQGYVPMGVGCCIEGLSHLWWKFYFKIVTVFLKIAKVNILSTHSFAFLFLCFMFWKDLEDTKMLLSTLGKHLKCIYLALVMRRHKKSDCYVHTLSFCNPCFWKMINSSCCLEEKI